MNNSTQKPVLVLGGGIAGISAALELTRLGHPVVLVEKGPFLGGRAAHFACKATEACQKCGACLVENRLRDLFQAPRLTIDTQTQLAGCRRENGFFRCTVRQRPLIDPNRCINCSLCHSECPAAEAGALVATSQSQHHPRYAIQPEHCLYFQDASCRICADICPAQAIDLTKPEVSVELEVAAVVLATGYQPADARQRPHYGYGRLPQVITGLELEEKLRRGVALGPDEGPPGRVAFIQCVGSRDQGHPFCSRVCCAYTLRMARLLKHRWPECQVTTFYMDFQNIGQEPGKFLAAVQEEITAIRVLPGDVSRSSETSVRLRYLDEATDRALAADFDLVVLAVGLGPGEDNPRLANLLHLELNPEGFFQAADAEGATSQQPGIFLVGTTTGPRSIPECIAQATAAALRLDRYLKSRP